MNWRDAIDKARGDEPVIHSTLTVEEAATDFPGYGLASGVPFTAWTKTRVFFPVVYAGEEWVGSAPRDPCDEALEHQGGE